MEITFKNKPLTLVGRGLKLGNFGPDFTVSSKDLEDIHISNYDDKIKVISTFPSLDTPVCELQVKEFNLKAKTLFKDSIFLGISKDLPFAQKRFCESFSVANVQLLSDYKNSSFGINYGLLIKELSLLARAVLILDKNNVVRYFEIVKEITSLPDYQQAMKSLEEVIKKPSTLEKKALSCRPCEGKVAPLSIEEINEKKESLKEWNLAEDKKLVRELVFKDFSEAKYFLDLFSAVAEEQKHHPQMTLNYNKLKVTLSTHAVKGLTDNDFIMAEIINEIMDF